MGQPRKPRVRAGSKRVDAPPEAGVHVENCEFHVHPATSADVLRTIEALADAAKANAEAIQTIASQLQDGNRMIAGMYVGKVD
jgi:hypothetical protein